MKNPFKLSFILLSCFVFTITSCTKDELESVNPLKDNSRIVFANIEDLYDTFDEISSMEFEEQISWINSSGIKDPLYYNLESCSDEIMLDMPRSFQALFNKDMELQINDTIIVFDKGNMFIKSIKGENLFDPIPFGSIRTEEYNYANTRLMHQVSYGKIGGSHQYKFYISGNKYQFKYVHELKSVIINDYPLGEFSRLFLIVKLEYYKGNNKWGVAGEPRDIQIDLNVYKRNLTNINYNYEVVIDTQRVMQNSNHQLDITGTIVHTVKGYPETKMTNGWHAPLAPWF